MRCLVRFSIIAALCIASAQAQPSRCFTLNEIQADQALRFSMKLMVISDACHRGASYTQFLQRNREPVASYQQEMIRHFGHNGDLAAEAAFDRYLSRLATEEGRQLGQQPLAGQCAEATRDFLPDAELMWPQDFRRMAQARALARQADYRVCSR